MRNRRYSLLIVGIFFSVMILNASAVNDTIIISSDTSTQRITRDLDSLINTWYVKLALIAKPEEFQGDTLALQLPDEVYESRLRRINSIISLPFNNIIRNHIQVYTVRQRDKFSIVLGLKDYYFPMIEDIFDSYGLPAELKYMAVIESALNPNAVSRMGATGLWQFMYSTGRLYGLTINSVVDERRDPIKSTHAAARFLKDLYGIYNDWNLVIAAYNCGPGNVNKAIKRSGNKKDYWEIYYRLPRETRGYLPQYLAAIYGVTYYQEEGIRPAQLNIPVATDTIMVNKDIHLAQISEVMTIPLGELRALNPQYRTGLIPGSSKPMALILPMNHLGDFIDLTDTIRSYKSDVYLNKATRIADPSRSTYITADIKGKSKIIYTVQEGDNLSFISEWYRIGLADLRNWNNINRNSIRIGQKIVIYVDPAKFEYYSRINSMTFEEKQSTVGKTIPSSSVRILARTPEDQEGEFITYTVRNGDTIWDIVKLYENVTTSQVLSLNNLANADKLQVGQRLKIKKKS